MPLIFIGFGQEFDDFCLAEMCFSAYDYCFP